MLEIYHGSVLYGTIGDGGFDLQDVVVQAPVAGDTTEAFLRKFESLYSTRVLAEVGAYTTGRVAIEQQVGQQMLLSKVPIPPLAILIAWSLAYGTRQCPGFPSILGGTRQCPDDRRKVESVWALPGGI